MNDEMHIQINNYDSYQTSPQEIDNLYQKALQVPVIRIYGSLVFKAKNCKKNYNILVHVHNYYPYLYLSCDYRFIKRKSNHIPEITEYLEQFMHSIITKTKPSTIKKTYIANVALCKGIPVYGYRVGYRLFYKISFLSPTYKSRFANSIDKLSTLNIFTTSKTFSFQVFESHIPFISQFLTDFNLFSCDWLRINHCYFRLPVLNTIDEDDNTNDLHLSDLKTYLLNFIKNNLVNYPRIGHSLLEIDIKTNYIENIKNLHEKQIHHSFNLHDENTINLKSLDSIIKDLSFQSNLHNLNYNFSNDFDNLIYGTTNWSNNLDLKSLLNYAIKLTKSYSKDLVTYQSKIIDPINNEYEHYPTIFQMTNLEKSESSKVVLDLMFVGELWSQTSKTSVDSKEDVRDVFQSTLPATQPIDSGTMLNYFDIDIDSNIESDIESAIESDFSVDSLDAEDNPLELGTDIDSKPDDKSNVNDDDSITREDKDASMEVAVYSRINDSQIFTQTHKSIHKMIDNPLSKENIIKDLENNGIVKINYPDPFYDRKQDTCSQLVFANKRIKVPYKQDIPNYTINGEAVSQLLKTGLPKTSEFRDVEYKLPPSKQSIIESYHENVKYKENFKKHKSQLNSISSNYKISINEKIDRPPNDYVQLSNFLMELHTNTTNNKLPDPKLDEISIIFYKFDDCNNCFHGGRKSGYIVNTSHFNHKFLGSMATLVTNEEGLLKELVKLVRKFDPDILSGYEINSSSWGYLIERSKELEQYIVPELSKTAFKNSGKVGDRWGYTHTSNISIVGRYTLNIWRVLRHELTLNNYSFENCCYHILHSSFPKLSNQQLTKYFVSSNSRDYLVGINYYLKKLVITEYFINSQELITKNTEYSRLIGIDFNSNFYRGSQFKVESILSRFAKTENYLLNSPSKLQVHKMRALEQIPLIMEPDSNFYKSPLLVLDFQSLYPSIMIAYNYCYSTLLCKLHGFNPHKNILGYLNNVPLHPFLIDVLNKQGYLNISPNGYVFVNQNLKKSILSKMLSEILTMRINIKKFLKLIEKNNHPQLFKVFNSRQLALKLIANVTYGYTSATFSGRMPNSDIADAIVSTGREILTQSIDMIENSPYGAKVVYGDTDSLFVYLPGKSKKDAFEIGDKLSDMITAKFPDPIKLKFEKVYHPCVLLSKKRYVGYSSESFNQEVKFDAKGIETIRRDGIPAQQKILEKALKILFDTSNLSLVKKYVQEQFTKVLTNKVIISDFCFAKEVRYGTYKNEKYLPPGAIVARKKVQDDHMSEPQYKERVPYVVIRDPTKHRLKDRCVSPEEFIENFETYKLDYEYYITKVLIPPLERIFNLMGCDIKQWYKELPKLHETMDDKVFTKSYCINCGDASLSSLCDKCNTSHHQMILQNQMNVKVTQDKLRTTKTVCDNCIAMNLHVINRDIANNCINQNCNNYYHRIKSQSEADSVEHKAKQVLDLI